MARYRIGLDIGGTFTDFVIYDEGAGSLEILKLPSTPADPSRAVSQGMEELFRRGMRPEEVVFFSHGTTVATNALLEEKGARTGLLITAGFRGVYEVMDQTRGSGPTPYDLMFEKPKLLAPPMLTEEVAERVDFQGNVLVPLDEARALSSLRRLKEEGITSLAVCLLFSFMNPRHEQRLRELASQHFPECHLSLSSEVLPQIREYYRLSTTVLNAYVAPILKRYLTRMESILREFGVRTGQLYVMQSNGGVTTFSRAAERAVTTVLSGPAAGVIAGARIGPVAELHNVISFDMGGTSCDVALVSQGAPILTGSSKISGRDINVPMIEINTVSAGGGTIAWIDEVGDLRLGPRSAGADPGPVCYGKGGDQTTVTDANLVLGYLNPDYFLGGKIRLNQDLAGNVLEEQIARPLGLEVMVAAEGIVRIISAKMADSIKVISSERGYDLREFVLVAFGGAGPLHAARVAMELGIGKVLVPLMPGATSALGLLLSDVRHDYMKSQLSPMHLLPVESAGRIFADLESRARGEMSEEGFEPGAVTVSRFLDMRYAGQGYELTVPLAPGELNRDCLERTRRDFDLLHERFCGHKAPGEPVEVVSYRLAATTPVTKVHMGSEQLSEGNPVTAKEWRDAYFGPDHGMISCPIYERASLPVGCRLRGPGIIEQLDSTTLVFPQQEARVDPFRNILIEVN